MIALSILGNFALILFVLLVVTGIIWFYDRFYLRRQRVARTQEALAEFDARNLELVKQGVAPQAAGRAELERGLMRQPTWVEYSGSFFPVILVVFVVRSFLYEPFKIPSGSMVPTLVIGDMILVNKFTYGIRLPILNKKVININEPQRGDVMVFKYPKDMSLDYIKRVIGVPGDRVDYRNKQLTINNVPVSYKPLPDYLDEKTLQYSQQLEENLTGVSHSIAVLPKVPPINLSGVSEFPFRENCNYNTDGFSCTVPAGQYFMMGDNRDNSEDSRYWGFVPEQNIVGKAFLIWMNLGDFKRIFTFFK